MTKQTDITNAASGLALKAHFDAPPDADIVGIEKIVAAIVSDKHALSAEELMAFESLLDAPDVDAEKRQELLQAIWNIVVCIIDWEWENHRRSTSENCSGEIPNNLCKSDAKAEDMLSSDTIKSPKTTDHAAAEKQQ